MLRIRKNGQSLTEYAILLIVVMGALIVGGVYLKRAIQGRWKASVEDLGDQYDSTNTTTNILYTMEQNSQTRITVQQGAGQFWTNRYDDSSSVERQDGSMKVFGY
ncbi:MAG TPA: hypothetical protein PL155_02575 [Candidatus Omnitrophota bacterium]|nr:hypothetical protein [Candidatus Omnitrophota bacterium]HPD84629.1 hypothetical protein [Candidatus Omnitrophota bacterium]HRZ03487.1 hypothetical protein [Candidatus Omnitrophota bacterium]